MRAPKDIDIYTSAKDAAIAIIFQGLKLLMREPTDRIKWTMTISAWNDEWMDKTKERPAAICTRMKLQGQTTHKTD